jgi:glycosyltransferase involved in cell wall biosynthesis
VPAAGGSDALKVLLVDPSRFTTPYDKGLSQGLRQAGIEPVWAVRPIRANEADDLSGEIAEPLFYKRLDRPDFLPRKLHGIAKSISHVAGLFDLLGRSRRLKADVVHFQWTLLPMFDAAAMWLLKGRTPVVLTVHDTTPFNGGKYALFQSLGYYLPMRVADRLIVHTEGARQKLLAKGLPDAKIEVVPHGPLYVEAEPRSPIADDGRWTFVTVGQIKPYKGIDVLIEAIGHVRDKLSASVRFVVAGAAHMDMAPLLSRIEALRIGHLIDIRQGRLSDSELAGLIAQADSFVFPYREIDASGVYFLTKPMNKWYVCSRVGIFAEDLKEQVHGALVKPADVPELAEALLHAANTRPRPLEPTQGAAWDEIGRTTRGLYEALLTRRKAR